MPARVFDIGCGEGWLARALSACGIEVTGIDAVPELIAEACAARRRAVSSRRLWRRLPSGNWRSGPFDAAVCNFSLLGEDSVESLLIAVLPHYLGARAFDCSNAASGCRVRRTSLPGWLARRELVGLRRGISAIPHPGISAPSEAGWLCCGGADSELIECREPMAPGASVPASVIFICKTHVPMQTDRVELTQ